VTTPTTGTIEAEGRIASLLEVGTGFHPELTGRENIYMNGSIMGMTHREIDRKLDEIVDFAGVERYLDTPTKRYSSGMTVRLGFAIAAHLDPEILVVDEVLAVGDAEFQKKAIGKMQDVSKGEGRTVLFVSHNMPSIKQLCKNGILLKDGSVLYSGNVEDTVAHYLGDNYLENHKIYFDDLSTALGNENIRIKLFEVTPISGNEINVESGLCFNLLFYNYKPNIMMSAAFELSTINDVIVFHRIVVLTPNKDSKKGIYEIKFQLSPFLLNAGKYKIKLMFGESRRYSLWMKEDILNFEVENKLTDQINSVVLPGIIKPLIDFKHSFLG
jgi:lipopolysaccharide transport system ATP-binding protein